MKTSNTSGHFFVWALIMTMPILFFHLAQSQPQNYYKGDPVAQLPAKSLPRIGRRSGQGEIFDPLYPYPGTDKMDPIYFNKEKVTGDNGGSLYVSTSENIPYPFQGNEHSSPYALMLFKRLLREGAFRPEQPTGIY